MKKGLKISTATLLAVSALTPVAAFAAESTVADGIYTNHGAGYYTAAQFSKLSATDKKAIFADSKAALVAGGTAYNLLKDVALKSDAQIDAVTTTVEQYEAAQGVKLDSGKGFGEVVVTELKVESVMAINAKTLQVTFNTPIEVSSVTGTNNTKLNANVVTLTRTTTTADANAVNGSLPNTTDAKLSEDGKTLTITAPSTKYFKGNYDVKVENAVKKDTVDKMENYYGKFVAADTAAPTVTGVTYNVASDKFEVTLSKPIDAKTGEVVRVNGQPIDAAKTSLGTVPSTKLTIERPADVEPGTTASIYVAGLKDAAGNLMNSYTGNVTVTKDTAALAVDDVKQIQNQKVRVTFNKKLNPASDTKLTTGAPALSANGLVVTKSDGATTVNYSVAAAPASENPDGNKYDITLTDATYANGNTEKFSITFVEDAFVGVSGTKNKVYTNNITLTKDTVAPAVQSAKVAVDGESVEVTLDKAIQSVAQANVKLRLNGAELTPVTAALKAGTNNVVVVKTTDASALTGSKLKAGTYQARFEAGAVTDLNGNTNATFNVPTVTVTGDTTVEPAKATIADSATNEFTVTAPVNEKFTAASLNYNNFVLDGQTIPANSDITFVDNTNKVITIKLPVNNSVNIQGSALLKATGLTFATGNPYATSSATVTVVDNTPATMTSAKILGNSIELTFNEAVKSSTLADIDAVLADFVIKSDAGTFTKASIASPGPGTDATATVVKGSSDKSIVITVTPADSNWSTVVAGTNLAVTTKEDSTTGKVTNLTDANNVKVKAPVKAAVAR